MEVPLLVCASIQAFAYIKKSRNTVPARICIGGAFRPIYIMLNNFYAGTFFGLLSLEIDISIYILNMDF